MIQRAQNSGFKGLQRYLTTAHLALAFCGIAFMFGGCGGAEGPDAANHDGAQQDSAEPTETPTDTTNPSGDDASALNTQEPNTVLRHAVFFTFKDSASAEDIQGVAKAFAALPAKIPEIIDFQWGTNNSPEGLDDGFTHCFLLTFADAKGRDVYLPHPDHKAFGTVLRPHMEKVFVIDYWGAKDEPKLEKTLRHVVFFKFKDDADPAAVAKVEQAFAQLPGKIDAIKAFEWGTNNSPEKHDAGFTHCFLVTFDSEQGRKTYLDHPDHVAFVDVLKPVLDKVRVLDFWAQ